MLRRVPRNLRRAVIAAVLLAVTFSVWQSWSSGTPGVGGWVQTPYGPLGPADRDLLVKVRLAGLWEQPTGQQAQQQALAPAVKEVGGNIAAEHGDLDRRVRETADKLGVLLPSAPTSQQMAWMAEISSKTGSDYDRAFAQRLREAHGAVLPLIAEVRASTRNELVRQFAAEADTFVSRHIQYLESTGLVDYTALPAAPSPGLMSGGRSIGDLVVPVLVFGAALLGAVGLAVALRNRDAGGRKPVPAPAAVPARTPRRREPFPPLIQIPAARSAESTAATPAVPPAGATGPYPVAPQPGDASGPYPAARAGDTSGAYAATRAPEAGNPYPATPASEMSGPYAAAPPSDTTGPFAATRPSESSGPYAAARPGGGPRSRHALRS